MIEVTAAVQAEIDAGRSPVLLVEIAFSTVTLRLTTAAHDVAWDGLQWLSNGFITGEPENSQQRELRASGNELNLTGVDLTVAAIVLGENQKHRPVTVIEAFLNSSGGVIAEPYVRDIYFINQVSVRQGLDTAQVKLSLAGEFADFEFRNGIRTTDNSLQRVHPGDRLFQYSTTVKKEQIWRGE